MEFVHGFAELTGSGISVVGWLVGWLNRLGVAVGWWVGGVESGMLVGCVGRQMSGRVSGIKEGSLVWQ